MMDRFPITADAQRARQRARAVQFSLGGLVLSAGLVVAILIRTMP